MESRLNADGIKAALARLHLAEVMHGRIKAYEIAVTGSGLTLAERHVLMRAAHIDPVEVGEPPERESDQ